MVNIDTTRKREQSPYGEFIRLYLELTTPTRKHMPDIRFPNDIITVPNTSYIGDLQTMTKSEIKNVKPKSKAQKEFLERWMDVMDNKVKEKTEEYIGECGLNEKYRKIKGIKNGNKI